MIIGTQDEWFTNRRDNMKKGRFNGAFYYAREIEHNIIPHIKTDMNWVLVRPKICPHNSIVFVHNNADLGTLDEWLSHKKNLILVSSNHDTQKYCEKFGESIFLPLVVARLRGACWGAIYCRATTATTTLTFGGFWTTATPPNY